MKLSSFLVFLTLLSCGPTTEMQNQAEQTTTSSSSTTLTTIALDESTTTTDKSNQNIYYGPITCQKISSTGIEISIEIDNPKDKAYSAYFQILDDSKYLSEGYSAGVGNYIDFIISANTDDKFEFKYIHKNIQKPKDLTDQELIDEYGITVLLFVNDKQISRECEYKLDFIKEKDTTTSTSTTSSTTTTSTTSTTIFNYEYLYSDLKNYINSTTNWPPDYPFYTRWHKENVNIKVTGNPSSLQTTSIITYVYELNSKLQNISFSYDFFDDSTDDSDINIFIGKRENWNSNISKCTEYFTEKLRYYTNQSVVYYEDNSSEFKNAWICLSEEEQYNSLLKDYSNYGVSDCIVYDVYHTISQALIFHLNISVDGEEELFRNKICNYSSINKYIEWVKIHYDTRNSKAVYKSEVYENLSPYTYSGEETPSVNTTTTTIPMVTQYNGVINKTPYRLSKKNFSSNNEWNGTIGNESVKMYLNPFGEWVGFIGDQSFKIIKKQFTTEDEWYGYIGGKSLKLNTFLPNEWNGSMRESIKITKILTGDYFITGPSESAILLVIINN